MHGTLGCPVCGTSNIRFGSPNCPACGVAFASPVVTPAVSPTVSAPSTAAVADRWSPVMTPPAPSTAAASAAPAVVEYASIWRRMVAGILDWVIVSIPFMILMGADYFDSTDHVGWFFTNDPVSWLETFVFLIYAASMQSSSMQATLGMQVMGLRLVREDDFGQVSLGRATARELATWVSAVILMIGYLMIAFTAKRQALHDKLARTLVVRDVK